MKQTQNPQKLYHIVWIDNYLEIPLEDLTEAFCLTDRNEFISTDKNRLKISIEKLENQYPYDHFIIREKK